MQPCTPIENPEKSRDRVLSDQELREIWFALDDDGDYSAILKILHLTAQRASEIADLRWSEINLDRDIIVLPSNRTNDDRVHIVPITSSVRAILEARPRREGRDFVFGVGKRGFSGWSKSKVRLEICLEYWTVCHSRHPEIRRHPHERDRHPAVSCRSCPQSCFWHKQRRQNL